MLTSHTLTIVNDSLEALTKRGDIFSAYDVTKVARTQTSQTIDHYDVQDQVHNKFLDCEMPSSYTRTLHTFKLGTGQVVQAYLYHLVGADLSKYDPDAVLQPHVAAVAALVSNVKQTGKTATFNVINGISPQAANKAHQIPTTNQSQVVKTDKYGRLCIPVALVKNAGFHIRDTVYLQTSSQQGLLVLTGTPWNHPQLGTTVVDRNSNIRVTSTMLRKNGYSGNIFKVRGDSTHLVIEQ